MKITRTTFESRKKYPSFSQLPKNGPVLVPWLIIVHVNTKRLVHQVYSQKKNYFTANVDKEQSRRIRSNRYEHIITNCRAPLAKDNRQPWPYISGVLCNFYYRLSPSRWEISARREKEKKKEKVEEQERKRGREKNNIFTRVQTLFRTFLRNLASYIILKKNRKQGGGWMREEGGWVSERREGERWNTMVCLRTS